MIYVLDTEGDSLTPTKFHVVSYQKATDKAPKSLVSYDKMKAFLQQDDATFIMHNGIGWDKPQLERVLDITIKARMIDTLFISWYIFPNRLKHGLEGYGDDFGVPKPEVDDWENLPLDVYVHRCEEDVKINVKLWHKQRKALARLYEVDDTDEEVLALPIIDYLMFKARCAQVASKHRWKLDKKLCTDTLATLTRIKEEKIAGLTAVMPDVVKYRDQERPAKPFKKDGTLSVAGAKWAALCRENGKPDDYTGSIKVVASVETPNPNSSDQVKAWLFGLGWEPATYKYVREDDGSERTIPQVRAKDADGNMALCPSVIALMEDSTSNEVAQIELLEGLTVASHRISILEGFLKNMDEDETVPAEIQGLTNTLRFKHKIIVNLPGVDKPYGKEIRGCLIAREGMELVGSDQASLEDMTKRHYMWDYDPEYVTEMSQPGFDAHLDLAIRNKAITKEDALRHVNKEADFSRIRKPYKAVNYSSIYGVGAKKLSRELRTTVAKAGLMLEAYWERNWAIKKLAEDQIVKTIAGQMWLFNPVSKFWYSLRYDKDRFSTLNQGTGVYCFDVWLGYILDKRPQITAQMHDEIVLEIKKGFREQAKKLLYDALEKTNKQLKLNVELGISVDFGNTYAQIH